MSTTNDAAVDYPNFTGYDRDEPVVVYGHVQKALHGKDSNGMPISLLVFRWHLQQRAPNRRFISASIRVVFKDTSGDQSGKTSSDDNLHVRTVAPNGTYGMGLTPDTITRTLALNESLVAGVTEATNTMGANFTLISQVTATEQIVLLERGELKKGSTDRTFQATFTIRTRTNGWMNKLAVWKRYGFVSPCKPVTFNTGVQWQEKESTEDKDWTERLGNADLFQLCNFYLFHLVPANKKDATPPNHPVQTPAEERHPV
ncbi:hypothetical protein CMQ_7334 [Grosmannia clavigera kw1407]|uniref:Uncharacterized protein n=1 Tax=Grosmannia clavigera (strain kw1407 / UAMH 11150) TaxID=655863 RepID=F0XNM5_GROCL|nr:uncharacterized protein CMQ_7334 [Grosmannia clavigera kw1407]EFX00332.1 hypothetical protein CMQ_7334 [Grosmannia clavigera kw1407]